MAVKKKKVVKKTSVVNKKKGFYHPETYGIEFDSMTFLLFAVFVLIAAIALVSNMVGIKLF